MSTSTEFVAPAASLPAVAVERPDLVAALDRALRRRAVLVVAPAGYGKSVLLAQWASTHPERTTAWVAARASDTAPTFGRRLAAAVAAVVPDAADGLSAAAGGLTARIGEDQLDRVAAALASVAPSVLVLEDLELLDDPELRRELVGLAGRVPARVSVVLVSRDDRFPGTESLRVRGELAEIRQADLALTAAEAATLVERVGGSDLSPAAAAALHERTDGWPAGVQLAALGLREADDPEAFVADFAGDDRHVADYLSGEVLARLPGDTREFLLATAVADRVTGPLCDALTGRSDGQRMLERLDGRSLFLRPLDRRREWFAYHPLFRDLLRYELRADDPDAEADLLARAAAWHLEHGKVTDAARLLIRRRDWQAVIDLAHREGGRFFLRGEPAIVQEWLEEVPEDHLVADVDAAIALAALRTMSGRTLAAQDLVERLEASSGIDNAPRRAEVAAIRAVWVSHHAPPAAAEPALELMAKVSNEDIARPDAPLLGVLTPPDLRALVNLAAGQARGFEARYEEARDLLGAVVAAPGSRVWLVHALGEQAWIDVTTGHLRRGMAAARRALATADEAALVGHSAAGMAHLALARGLRLRGEVAPVDHLAAGLASGAMNQRRRVAVAGAVDRVHEALVRRRIEVGLGLAADLAVTAAPPLAPAESARLAALEARLHLLAGDLRAARRRLEAEEVPVTAELAAARAAVAAGEGDEAGLRKAVEGWDPVDGAEPGSVRLVTVWRAVLADVEGDRSGAVALLADAVDAAEAEGDLRLVLDEGPEVLRLARETYHRRPSPFLRRVVDAAPATGARQADALVEQLTERELAVLGYLPSRLSNADIAERIYVSVNTLKTHLKSIYRKLGVSDRDGAIERADELGLL